VKVPERSRCAPPHGRREAKWSRREGRREAGGRDFELREAGCSKGADHQRRGSAVVGETDPSSSPRSHRTLPREVTVGSRAAPMGATRSYAPRWRPRAGSSNRRAGRKKSKRYPRGFQWRGANRDGQLAWLRETHRHSRPVWQQPMNPVSGASPRPPNTHRSDRNSRTRSSLPLPLRRDGKELWPTHSAVGNLTTQQPRRHTADPRRPRLPAGRVRPTSCLDLPTGKAAWGDHVRDESTRRTTASGACATRP